jgi:hypothetical protein
VTLDQGESAFFDYPDLDQNVFIDCSNNCLVAQYSKYVDNVYGNFMHYILSDTEFYTSTFFATVDANPLSYLSLVVVGESTGHDILLNGMPLDGLTWTPFHGYTTVQLDIAEGSYELESTEGRPLAAYVYSHLMHLTAGAGYTLLPQASFVPTTPSPTTTPVPPGTALFRSIQPGSMDQLTHRTDRT